MTHNRHSMRTFMAALFILSMMAAIPITQADPGNGRGRGWGLLRAQGIHVQTERVSRGDGSYRGDWRASAGNRGGDAVRYRSGYSGGYGGGYATRYRDGGGDRSGYATRYRDYGGDRSGYATRYRDGGGDRSGYATRYRDDGGYCGGSVRYGYSSPGYVRSRYPAFAYYPTHRRYDSYGPRIGFSFVITNYPAAGFYYYDPYCDETFASLALYRAHMDNCNHPRVIEVISEDESCPTRSYCWNEDDGDWEPY